MCIRDSFNGTNIGRIEDKMGCHGSSTCEINFDESTGWLIGAEQGHTRVLQLHFNWSFWRSNVSEKAYTLRELEER